MLEILSNYLSESATPELKAAIERAYETLERLQADEAYQIQLNELFMQDAQQEDTLGAIRLLFYRVQREYLQMFSVQVNEDADLDFCTDLLEGLQDLADCDSEDEMRQICNQPLGSCEIFAELMTLVTSLSAEDVLVNVTSVSNSLIQTVLYQLDTRGMVHAIERQEPSDVEREQVALLLRFTAGLQKPRIKIVELIESGLRLGYDFKVYVDHIGRDLEVMSAADAANELVGMALVSNDAYLKPQESIRSILEQYVADPNTIVKIDSAVTQIVLRLTR